MVTMKGAKKNIDINDIRADRGGDPEIYRRALSMYNSSSSTPSIPQASPPPHPNNGDEGGRTASATYVDDALTLDSQRRSALSNLEGLRSKLSNLQRTVIAPKMKAHEDVTREVAQSKEWKAEIMKLSNDAKDAEKRRDALLEKMNEVLANINFDGMDSRDVGCSADNDATPGADRGNVFGVQAPKKVQQPLSISAAEFSPKSSAKPTDVSSPASSTALPLLSPEEIKSIPPERILNLNVGVLGHVDTGKTSLVKTLSSVLSTAALDKSKQSRARGITLDLGFSAFLLPLPEHLRQADAVGSNSCEGSGNSNNDGGNDSKQNVNDDKNTDAGARDVNPQNKYDLLQVTLVDCPGHASLIRTIIGGAQIIDMILLVVDATKGMQTQTAECLVIAEMTTRNLIVVLNKTDMFPEHEREARLRAAEKKMRAALRGTKFADAQMVGISACVGGEKVAAVGGASGAGDSHAEHGGITALKVPRTHNIHGLLNLLQSQIRAPNRDSLPSPDQFHFAVDHCFPIKGQGTVLTGTCLAGSARPNDMIEFPTLATQKKIKGLQMFRRKAGIIQQGDRAGICVSNFDAKLMERGIIASPGTVKLIRGAIAVVRKVRFFKGGLNSGAKFHISVGHTTVMATVTFWGAREIAKQVQLKDEKNMENLSSPAFGKSSLGGSAELADLPRLQFDWNKDFLHQDNYLDALRTTENDSEWKKSTPEQGKGKDTTLPPLHWARLEFLTPVYCPMDSLVIGSRLDSEVSANACRLAFSGRLVERYDAKSVSDVIAE
jgi:selenocysteine-specific elongation factor